MKHALLLPPFILLVCPEMGVAQNRGSTAFSQYPLRASAAVQGRRLIQNVRFVSDQIEVCVTFQSVENYFVLTRDLQRQTQTGYSTFDDRPALRVRTMPLSSLPMPPQSFDPKAYLFLSREDGVIACKRKSLADFVSDQFIVESRFQSWLQLGSELPAWVQTELVQDAARGRPTYLQPLRSDIVLKSNTCVVDRRRRLVRC